ncbi:MAG TPA: class II fructose-bisphosphate aldolase [Dehalococcoidales bacterium]|nr:class II fructose-bisphosphate aldolase [Dehalococcoidales bacterium]
MPEQKKPRGNSSIDTLINEAVFGVDALTRENKRREIRKLALEKGVYPASIQAFYEAAGRGKFKGLTVPAINIRGITYDVARAVFRAAKKDKVGAFIFEIARSEIGYTAQEPSEYSACVFAAAIKEGFKGPAFIQGDHFQVRRAMFRDNPTGELNDIRKLIRDSIEAGFYNIDIDASTLVDISKEDLTDQQAKNSEVTAAMTRFIRSIEPYGVTVSIGGEIGEIGKGNSTAGDLKAFMDSYLRQLSNSVKGISKISIQTGTTHGGVVLPDGSLAQVSIAFETIKELSELARQTYGLGGAVQHGASTLPDEAFDMFPKVEALEVHLATGFQNIIYDSTHFPQDLRDKINKHLDTVCNDERKQGETEEQFIYKTRKKAFGDFKKELWGLPEDIMTQIMKELQERFSLMFHKLNVTDTVKLVGKYIKSPR